MQVMKRLSLATATCLSFLVFIYVHLSLTAITNLTILQGISHMPSLTFNFFLSFWFFFLVESNLKILLKFCFT